MPDVNMVLCIHRVALKFSEISAVQMAFAAVALQVFIRAIGKGIARAATD